MIPSTIMLTYKSAADLPAYVIDNVRQLNPDKTIAFFSDTAAEDFLRVHYGSRHAAFFNQQIHGCIKADFFRYCYLYKCGGYYCDVDIEHVLPIASYIAATTEFFSVISVQMLQYDYKPGTHRSIFQALLFTKPGHPIIANCIADIMAPYSDADPFRYATLDIYKNTAAYLRDSRATPQLPDFTAGAYLLPCGTTLQLGDERYRDGRHGCYVDDALVAYSRYSNYTRAEGFR